MPLRRNFSIEYIVFAFSESLNRTQSPVEAVLPHMHGKMSFFKVFPDNFLSAIIKSCSCNLEDLFSPPTWRPI